MINKAILLGKLGTKKFKTTQNGSIICMMQITTYKKYTDSKGKLIVKPTLHFVNFFDQRADMANKISNIGDLIYLEGEIDVKREVCADGECKIHYSIVGDFIKIIHRNRSNPVYENSVSDSCEPEKTSEE